MLKSLIDWEKSHRESEKFIKINHREGSLAEDSVDITSREDSTSAFERAKAHKSTLEDGIAEVTDHMFFKLLYRERNAFWCSYEILLKLPLFNAYAIVED